MAPPTASRTLLLACLLAPVVVFSKLAVPTSANADPPSGLRQDERLAIAESETPAQSPPGGPSQRQTPSTNEVCLGANCMANGALFASGTFLLPDLTVMESVARWTGTGWHVLGSGTNSTMFEFFDGYLYGAAVGQIHGHSSHDLSRGPSSSALDTPRFQPHDTSVSIRVNPHPTGGPVTLRFTLAYAGRVRLTMHDLKGRQVSTVLDGLADAGEHTVLWSAPAPPGVYFSRLELPDGKVHVMRVVRLE